MKHSWKQLQERAPGGGRRWTANDEWVCRRCGVRKGRSPHTRWNGKLAFRWWVRAADGSALDRLPTCIERGADIASNE